MPRRRRIRWRDHLREALPYALEHAGDAPWSCLFIWHPNVRGGNVKFVNGVWPVFSEFDGSRASGRLLRDVPRVYMDPPKRMVRYCRRHR